MASSARSSGSKLTVDPNSLDEIAIRISEMWDRYNTERRNALHLNEEARRFVYATDIDSTSANILPHKNRTHQPKLTQIADTLKSQYYEASLSSPEFFRINSTPDDYLVAKKAGAWLRTKLEIRKFRDTVGRQLINDYVDFGNCFATVDYIKVFGAGGELLYKGPEIKRVSPLDVIFNPSAESFAKSPKVQRVLMHVGDIATLPERFPSSGFIKFRIDEALKNRHPEHVDDWVEVIKNRGLNMDGFGGFDQYFKQDMAEVLIYRGDVFDPESGEVERNRVLYVMDRTHVIRNAPSRAPQGFDGMHHAGWRSRADNLWAQGPLDNLLGMQYRIDHLENLKADVFDLIAHPALVIKGENVQEPEEGYAPGAVYYAGVDEDVSFLVPDATALNANTEIQLYHRMMEEMAGAPPESRGIRTPGEKTAFEVSKLDQNATMMFVDKARIFERMLEGILKEALELMFINYDGDDYMTIFDDEDGEKILRVTSLDEVKARGEFTAMGSRHWSRRNRETLEMQDFMAGPMQDPRIRAHISGLSMAQFWARKLNFDDEGLIEPFAGVIEDVRMQAVAQSEAQTLQQGTQEGPVAIGDASGTGTEVAPGQEGSAETL